MRPNVRACTEFRFAQVLAAFPPLIRVLVARLTLQHVSYGLERMGLLRLRGITPLPRP